MKNKQLLLIAVCFCLAFSLHAQTRFMPRINHIAVYVVNLEKSTRFYQEVIGLDSIPEPFHDGRHNWFSIGPGSQLHIISGAAKATAHDKNAHLCFSVTSMEDFITNLQKHKVPYEDWAGTKGAITTRVDGVKQIWFQYPDGYWIEINNDRQQ